MNEITAKPARNAGIDLLRMVSMFLVALLHVLGQGGVLSHIPMNTPAYKVAWLLEVAGYCCVDVYALISGYVGFRSRFRYSQILLLWLRVVFYTLLITAVFAIVLPGTVSAETWLCAIFPVFKKQYWYFTAYFGMFFFIPCFNLIVEKLSRAQMRALLFAAAFLFSLMPALMRSGIFGQNPGDVLGTGSGYSLLWLALLYLAGAYLGKYDLPARVPGFVAWICFAACTLVAWLFKIDGNAFLVNYTSPTVLLAALALLAAFSRFSCGRAGKVISFCSALSFSVYLIHVHPLIWDALMYRRFVPLTDLPAPLLALAVLGSALGIFIVCSLIDLVREGLFRLLRLKERLSRLEEKCVGDLWRR